MSENARMEPLSYDYVTKDICKKWTDSGRADLASRFQQADLLAQRTMLHELVWRCLGQYISTDDLNGWLGSTSASCNELSSVLIDVILVIDAEVSLEADADDHKSRLAKVTSLAQKMGAGRTLQERMDLETGTLEKAEIIQNQKQFQQRYIRAKTRLFYKQQKFNLLREEIEGYSKLATELYECTKPEETLENIKSLIGCFNIDPNRVLDICLEWLEHSIHSPRVAQRLISSYLRLCDASTLTNLLGFKFQHYAGSGTATPDSLYQTAAILLRANLVTLNELFPHMSPSDEDIKQTHEKISAAMNEKVRKMGTVQLGEKKKDEVDISKMEEKNNQKFGLAKSLIELGDWTMAKSIIDRYPLYCAVTDDKMARAIASRCHQIIEPIYRAKVAKKFAKAPEVVVDPIAAEFQVTQFGQLHEKLMPILTTLGPMMHVDPLLFMKIVRLMRAFFKEYKTMDEGGKQQNKQVYATFLQLLEDVLFPTLTLLDCCVVQSEEIWQVLKHLNYELRYRLYGYWKNASYKLHPHLILSQAKSVDRTKYILKRLTKDTVKQSGRQLGKISHSNPGSLFDTILVQIQRYDNLIGPVVDTLKYLTNMSYDMLLYCVVEALSNPEKEQMKTDGTTISDWLQSLANFCGTVCKKYSIDLVGLLQYVANKLKTGNSLDLLLLKEVVQKMSGIEANEEVTDDQLAALAGGELLRTEGGYFGQIRNVKKPSTRLRETLINHKLALPLCLLMSTHRAHIVFKEGVDVHLKLVGKLTDQCHDTLFQFGGFLSANLNQEEYTKQVPKIESLISTYGTPWDVAFFISRQMYNHQITTHFEEKTKDEMDSTAKTGQFIDSADTVLLPIAATIESMHPDNVWQDISPHFYTSFWTMTMYDIATPKEAYEKEVNKLKVQIKQVDSNSELNSGKRKREKERLEAMIEKMQAEERKQEEHRRHVFSRLQRQCENWFPARTTKNDAITTFLRLCMFPRSIFSALDATYCARIVQLIHELRIPNFSTLLCYDRVFTDISTIVPSLTENEASRYGRFLSGMLTTVMRWHSDPGIYEEECGDFPGFVTVVRSGTKNADGSTKVKANQLDYENYRHVCHKWQYKLTKALVLCLESGEYVQIRNGLMILTKILHFFPMVQSLGTALEKRVEKVRNEEKDKRQDLYALAMGYAGQLRSRKQYMVPENQFHTKDKNAPAPPMSKIKKEKDKNKKAQQLETSGERERSKARSEAREKTREKSEGRKRERSTQPDAEPVKKARSDDIKKDLDSLIRQEESELKKKKREKDKSQQRQRSRERSESTTTKARRDRERR